MNRTLRPRLITTGLVAAGLLLLGACTLFPPPVPPLEAKVHFVLERPYQIGAIWYYPHAQYDADDTGLAAIAPDRHGLTADGEVFDQTALAAGNRTLQLPAIARVTNLENGRQIVVRINDRGPAAPGRLLSLTKRAAELLQLHGDGTRIRLQVMDTESRQLSTQFEQEGPALQVEKAPVTSIETETLAPPGGAAASSRRRTAPQAPTPVARATSTVAAIPLRLPEAVTVVSAVPTRLYVDAGSFGRQDYAYILVNRLSYLGARLTTSYNAPRDRAYRIRIGPFDTVAEAEAVLARTIVAGVNDATIVVE